MHIFVIYEIISDCFQNCSRTESKNYTREELQNDTLKFTVNATELKPAVTYTMTVFAYNIGGKGKPNNVPITTDEEGPCCFQSCGILCY